MPTEPNLPEEEISFSDNENLEKGKEKIDFKQPEFIIIDEREGKNQYTYFGSDSSKKFKASFQNETEGMTQPARGSIFLRFLCLFGLIFCLAFGLGLLIWSILLTVVAALSFFQNQNLNSSLSSFWKLYVNIVIVGFGLAIGIISPTLGLGLIGLYFSIKGEIIENNLLRKILKRSLNL